MFDLSGRKKADKKLFSKFAIIKPKCLVSVKRKHFILNKPSIGKDHTRELKNSNNKAKASFDNCSCLWFVKLLFKRIFQGYT